MKGPLILLAVLCPAAWHHAAPAKVERSGDWTVLHAELNACGGVWRLRDSYRMERGLLRGIRRFTWTGKTATPRITLSVRFDTLPVKADVLLPGILYYGNPNGARSNRVPVSSPESIYEEHRYPAPFASLELTAGHRLWRAVLHTLPSLAPHANLPDQWWSMGVQRNELVLLSGACAPNGRRSVIKGEQPGFIPYDNAYLTRPAIVMGWTGQAEAPGYALQVLDKGLSDPDALSLAQRSLDYLSQAAFYESGFHNWFERDKNAAAAFQNFLELYEVTRSPEHLAWARHASDVMLTYTMLWDTDMPAGRLRDHNVKARGWTLVSVQNMHLDVWGAITAPEVYRLGVLDNREDLKLLALVMYRSAGQLIDAYGGKGEQLQQTNYAQRGRYHEEWTVFWITAHFLTGAARFAELGLDIWRQ